MNIGVMMHRRSRLSVCTTLLVFIVVAALYFHNNTASRLYHPGLITTTKNDEIPPGGILSRGNVTSYIGAIFDQKKTHLPKLNCLNSDFKRYEHLKISATSSKTPYFFALNLRENLAVLPRLLGSIVEVIQFLGPSNCALSIVEGNSPDGTGDVLAALQAHLDKGLRTHIVLGNKINPLEGLRFAKLAELRNLALKPILEEPERYSDSTVIFVNDVVICPDDILELIHQRVHLAADMTCAMDWVYGSAVPTFYDVYIARGINGDLFFDVPPDVSWSKATNLFWNDPESKERFNSNRPVQVFACWNGAVAFTANPVATKQVTFRAARENTGECYNGEPEIFCKDLWFHGYGKIAVVPYIHLAYTNEAGKRIKDEKGYTSKVVKRLTSEDAMQWKPPPEKVKCMPSFDRQSWQVWNETLGDHI
ncbi:glycosyltransferase family 69 protein [Pochonia chlamydosporia 170]|uniref:Glycosyltransferase family 69 protein n=1 Tax=Pochonia chlamydosporia 170 TaxID=1380566 RepID=A0A179F1U5_METCM|nr:glycosyltransferase family 69 protein [Pochonia chlamydosporia 170]OAQ59260.1 glycosyltransferase family 69 protein [Pochonia chlamydosporia 170]